MMDTINERLILTVLCGTILEVVVVLVFDRFCSYARYS